MEHHPDIPPPALVLEKPKVSYWRKLGGGSLTISIIVHAILLAIGVVLVIQVIPPEPEKIVDFMAKSGGGGAPAQSPSQQKQRVNMMRSNAARIAAKDVSSPFTLPEPEASSDMNALGDLGSGGLSGGLGGAGSGGGLGIGTGQGVGSGMGIGMSNGKGSGNPFGDVRSEAGSLTGVLYDLKQTKQQKPTNMNSGILQGVIREFVKKGFKERELGDYYQAPQKLKQTRIYVPAMDATKAPEAFKCEKEVQPRMWAVVYRGTVIAPKTGKFRFVGAADDFMVVRFNNVNVFDFGFMSMTFPYRNGKFKEPMDSALEREARSGPMTIPLIQYPYPTTKHYNSMGGIGVGKEFEVQANAAYPIEILICEVPGGLFSAALMIEEIGATYKKDKNNSPIFPLFRTSGDLPKQPKDAGDNIPPFDKDSPIWKVASGSGRIDI